MNKLISKAQIADMLHDGMTVMIGGFLSAGSPEGLIDILIEKEVKDLYVIGNDTCFPDRGTGKLIVNRQVKQITVSHIGTNPETGKQMIEGTLKVELCPQGSLAERIRAAGAGLGGFYTPTGVGTMVEEGKEKKVINGVEYILETPLTADIAFVKAWKADKKGNLVFLNSARNFNPLIAMAAKTVIVEAEEVVEVGEIDPNIVVTPGLFVDYIYQKGVE